MPQTSNNREDMECLEVPSGPCDLSPKYVEMFRNGRYPVPLTKREVEVLSLVNEVRSSKKVAGMLFLSKRTVDFHLTNIYRKLHVTNRVQAHDQASRFGYFR